MHTLRSNLCVHTFYERGPLCLHYMQNSIISSIVSIIKQPLSMNRKNCVYESRVKHSTQSKCFPTLFHSVMQSPSAGRIMEATCSVKTLNILMYESALSCYTGQSTLLKPKHMLRCTSAKDVLNNKPLNTGVCGGACSQPNKKWCL